MTFWQIFRDMTSKLPNTSHWKQIIKSKFSEQKQRWLCFETYFNDASDFFYHIEEWQMNAKWHIDLKKKE